MLSILVLDSLLLLPIEDCLFLTGCSYSNTETPGDAFVIYAILPNIKLGCKGVKYDLESGDLFGVNKVDLGVDEACAWLFKSGMLTRAILLYNKLL